MGQHTIAFDEKRDLPMNKRQKLPYHTNGMRFTAYDANDAVIATRDYYSVGGGFVVNQTMPPTIASSPTRRHCPTRSSVATNCWRNAHAAA